MNRRTIEAEVKNARRKLQSFHSKVTRVLRDADGGGGRYEIN